MSKNKILITCAKGSTPFLAEEVRQLGLPVLSEGLAGVQTEGTMTDARQLNLRIRTGHRVLFLLKEFRAFNAEVLYKETLEIPWEEYIPDDGYISVTSSVDNPTIRDTRYANLKCKDAIVTRIMEKCDRRPDSGPDQDRAVVNLYWKREKASIYLDTSGTALSRRGYRKIPLDAPMQETLSAAVNMATNWDMESHFINPMCGSGTLAIEAALMALNRAPGLLRSNFGFMHLHGFDSEIWQQERTEVRREGKKKPAGKIIATDNRPEAIQAARKNAATAGVDHLIEFSVCDYSETPIPPGSGIVILNPEYGERMGEIRQLEKDYRGIGDFFKNRCSGYTGYIFTGNIALSKKVGLRAKRRIPFFSGGLECRLFEYELYTGSKKHKNSDS